MAQATILFADNDPDFLATRKKFLEQEGYRVILVQNTTEARNILAEKNINLAILDIRLEDDEDEKDVSGLAIAKAAAYQDIPKIILTGFPSPDAAREALRQDLNGLPPALDFLEKEQGVEAMLIAVQHALAISRRQWQSFLGFGSMLLLGAAATGVIAVIFDDPRWLVGTVLLCILFALSTRRLAVR